MARVKNKKKSPYLQIQFGANVKKFRQLNGFTMAALAEKCDLSDNYIVEIEMGRKFPTAKVMESLFEALHVEPFQLFSFADDTKHPEAETRLKILEERLLRSIKDIFQESR